MELTGLTFRNYKAFGSRETVDVRPLTILIGKNSSGKSAIARLPLLLAASLSSRAQAPIDLAGDELDLGGSFRDIVHNQRPHGNVDVGATFSSPDGEVSFLATIQFYEDLGLQVIRALQIKNGNLPPGRLIRLSEDPEQDPASYLLEHSDGSQTQAEVSFKGLRPHLSGATLLLSAPPGKLPRVVPQLPTFGDELATPASVLAEAVYLGPFRQSPSRTYRFPGGLPQNVGRAGATAPALLAADFRRRGGAVLREVAAWYREHLGGWDLDVDMAANASTFSMVLRKPSEPTVGVNLVDVGTGLSQVLPVVTQRLFERVTGKRAALEIVEQPELHLHPAAHGSLADLYITAASAPGTRFLVETHSENFVLRVRRRIAEGRIPSERVRIYWVDDSGGAGSTLRPVDVYPNGDVDHWPKGVFSEDFEELKAIRAAQHAGSAGGGRTS